MSLDEFSQYVSWALYVLIFVITAAKALRRPIEANIDIALFFSLPALIIGISIALSFELLAPNGILTAITLSLLLGMEYMLLRLVDDFSRVPRWVMRSSTAALGLLIIGSFLLNSPLSTQLFLVQLFYMLGLLGYTIVAFLRESSRTSGVTRRRMRAVAIGSMWLCVIFFLLGLSIFFEDSTTIIRPLTDFASVASGVSYFLGFATPSVLRRAWQEPELRAFLGRAAALPRLPNTQAITDELERGAAHSLGATNSRIALWDEKAKVLWMDVDGTRFDLDPDKSVAGRAFLTQKPMFTDNLQRESPTYSTQTRERGAVALLAAPITAGEKRLGVLTVYAARAPIFADEDLDLVKLLADQAAVILESRALIDEAARVQAREEATRMKDDFLSAAAHDLKTPLTTLVVQSELLERRAARSPDAPADLDGLRRMTREVHRLKNFVLELLDAARAEQGRLLGVREDVDLVAASVEVCERHSSERHSCIVRADGSVGGMYDPNRIFQLLENLVENAVKYSPDGGTVEVRLWQTTGAFAQNQNSSDESRLWNHITVSDEGIGVPAGDLPQLFERFHRGSNVDDRSFSGMGLGLFICKGIVEQHGGEIWVEHSEERANGKNNTRSKGNNETGGVNYGSNGNTIGEAITSTMGTNDISRAGTGHGTIFHVALPVAPALDATAPASRPGAQGLAG